MKPVPLHKCDYESPKYEEAPGRWVLLEGGPWAGQCLFVVDGTGDTTGVFVSKRQRGYYSFTDRRGYWTRVGPPIRDHFNELLKEQP